MLESGLFGATEYRTDACVGVLYERTCIAVEIDRFLGVERHVLARVDFKQEVFQRAHTYRFGNIGDFCIAESVEFAELLRYFAGSVDHFGHQVVGVDHCPFAAFHFAFG